MTDDILKEKMAEITAGSYKINDSGERQEFSTGMKRDSCEKIRYDLIPLFALERWASHMTAGAKKYEPRNWQKAETKEELERFVASACRHFFAWLQGETEEDAMAGVFFNMAGAEMVMAKLKRQKVKLTPMEDFLDGIS